jgi:hypothetical protein
MDLATKIIEAFNWILLIGLVAGILRWQRTHGKLAEKKLAIILCSYFSFSFITNLIPVLITHPEITLIVDAGFVTIVWIVLYPFCRWVYRHFNQSK